MKQFQKHMITLNILKFDEIYFIHGKDLVTKLLEVLIRERMKPPINEAIQELQFGGKAGHVSV